MAREEAIQRLSPPRIGTRVNSPRGLQACYNWLEGERDKWTRTKKCRELGDDNFSKAEYASAVCHLSGH